MKRMLHYYPHLIVIFQFQTKKVMQLFSILWNRLKKTPRIYIDNDSRKEKKVPSSMCEGKTLRIYTKNLEIKRNYYINTSVELLRKQSELV